jgi:hypothetical protein
MDRLGVSQVSQIHDRTITRTALEAVRLPGPRGRVIDRRVQERESLGTTPKNPAAEGGYPSYFPVKPVLGSAVGSSPQVPGGGQFGF